MYYKPQYSPFLRQWLLINVRTGLAHSVWRVWSQAAREASGLNRRVAVSVIQ